MALSILNIAATVVSVSYKIDMSSVGRDVEPTYYGLFSDSKAFLRMRQLVYLFLFNASHLTMCLIGWIVGWLLVRSWRCACFAWTCCSTT